MKGYRTFALAAAFWLVLPILPGVAQQGVEDLAKEEQSPLARFTRVQIEDNAQFGFGPDGELLNVLRFQPVVPFELNPGWSLIARIVIPIVHQPWPARADGLSDIVLQALLTPTRGGSFIWGVGPALSFPSATDEIIGTGKWSAGPVAAGVFRAGPWVVGTIVTNLWSFAGDESRAGVNILTLRPLINYNLPRGWYLTSSAHDRRGLGGGRRRPMARAARRRRREGLRHRTPTDQRRAGGLLPCGGATDRPGVAAAVPAHVPVPALATLQERAYTSPIWYTP
jgi:hypothetical protein